MRAAGVSGVLMLALMWLAEVPFAQFTSAGEPTGSPNPFADSHYIYAVVLVVLAATYAGTTWGWAAPGPGCRSSTGTAGRCSSHQAAPAGRDLLGHGLPHPSTHASQSATPTPVRGVAQAGDGRRRARVDGAHACRGLRWGMRIRLIFGASRQGCAWPSPRRLGAVGAAGEP
jgi:hypothetical protein